MKTKYFIKKNQEFQEIINLKDSFGNRTFLIAKRLNNKPHNRFGLSVGKKLGNAVFRNKTKRQIRHILRELSFKEEKKCYDIVIIAKKSIIGKDFSSIKRDLKHVLHKFIK